MNNKGFAISGMLYGIFMLFLMLLLSLLNILLTRINRLSSLADNVTASVEDVKCADSDDFSCRNRIGSNNYVDSPDDIYITKYRGLYKIETVDIFGRNRRFCNLYLPNNIALILYGNNMRYVLPDENGVINVSTSSKHIFNNSCVNNIRSFKIVRINSSSLRL